LSTTYFGENEEYAMLLFLSAKTQYDRTVIFNEHLKYAFTKLVESIIRTYGLHSKDEDFDEQFNDSLSFIMTKIENFKPGKIGKSGKPVKAYSYFGTITKRYLISKLKDKYEEKLKSTSYDDISHEINDDERFSYNIDDETNFHDKKFFIGLGDAIKKQMGGNNMKQNDMIIGNTIVELLERWDSIFDDKGNHKGSVKFNKNLILLYLREITGLQPKDIRKSLKHFKRAYVVYKKSSF
jgi:hypothetical protein